MRNTSAASCEFCHQFFEEGEYFVSKQGNKEGRKREIKGRSRKQFKRKKSSFLELASNIVPKGNDRRKREHLLNEREEMRREWEIEEKNLSKKNEQTFHLIYPSGIRIQVRISSLLSFFIKTTHRNAFLSACFVPFTFWPGFVKCGKDLNGK